MKLKLHYCRKCDKYFKEANCDDEYECIFCGGLIDIYYIAPGETNYIDSDNDECFTVPELEELYEQDKDFLKAEYDVNNFDEYMDMITDMGGSFRLLPEYEGA